MKGRIALILLLFASSACISHHQRIDGDHIVLALRYPDAKNVVLFCSFDEFKPRKAIKVSNNWESKVPAGKTFTYFYRVDETLFVPDCPIKEKDDFGTDNTIDQAQNEIMNCAKAGLPTEPVMNKASEGIAKKASERQIIAAMQTVHSRYARANRMAKTLSSSQHTVDEMTYSIADSMAAVAMDRAAVEKAPAAADPAAVAADRAAVVAGPVGAVAAALAEVAVAQAGMAVGPGRAVSSFAGMAV